LKQFNTEVQQSQNPFASSLFPLFEQIRQRDFATMLELAMMRAAVEYKLHGEPGLKSVTDPYGKGPFIFQRFIFEGVDRGFELKSTYTGRRWQEMLIFIEKGGPPIFYVSGPRAGKAVPTSSAKE
jgi:hypothetical protein